MRKVWLSTLTGAGLWAVCSAVQAAGPSVAQVLSLKPTQADVLCDVPTSDNVNRCKLEVLKKPQSGWVLHDHRGLVIRRFIDANGDNVVDRWSFYMNGQEVYRDTDTNFNGKADQCQWYHTAGSRWGVDENEDGVIDSWKQISAEEASSEAVQALLTRDFDRMKRVMVNEADFKTLGLGPEATQRVAKSLEAAPAKFQKVSLPKGAQFSRFDGHNPMTVPASDIGGAQDVFFYGNVTILLDAGGQTVWLRAPEVVRVGSSWKLTDVPGVIDPSKSTVAGERVLVPAMEQAIVKAESKENDELIEDGEEIQKFVTELQTLDQQAPGADDLKALVRYHIKRAELCAHIGSKSKKLKNREHWYKQTADSLNAAAQTGEYQQGITTLNSYADQFGKTNWGKTLAGYFKYRAINADYALQLAKPDADHAKAQGVFLENLKKFLDLYPGSEDSPDALWQLGNGMEFSANDENSKEFYRRLATEYPKTGPGKKAAGAIRRLEAVGQPLTLAGDSLTGETPIDVASHRGKVVLVSYWSTWCEPCKAETPRIARIRQKYATQGFEVVGVSLDNTKQAATEYVRKNGLAWPNIYEEGSMDSAPAVQYGIISLPYFILVDAEGRVLNRNVNVNQLESEIEKAMVKKVANRKD